MPDNEPNTRFFSDALTSHRPALTFNGFDCSDNDTPICSYGMGIKQVLNEYYNASNQNELIQEEFEALIQTAKNSLQAPGDSRSTVNANSNAVQAKAFVALVTFVLEENCELDSGCSLSDPPWTTEAEDPTTGLPEDASVRVTVYDALGRRVARVASGSQEAGWHSAEFEAADLSAGVYLVRMRAGGDFAVTKRLVVAK